METCGSALGLNIQLTIVDKSGNHLNKQGVLSAPWNSFNSDFFNHKIMRQDFTIRQWSVWPPIQQNEELDRKKESELLSTVPKMLRRRLSPLAKIVFCAANQCIDENTCLPTVFSSTHGELAKSFGMMEMIEAGEEISPTAFSLSVHNAIAGLFSMAHHNNTQSTVVAPGEEGMAPAFIEALGLLKEGAEQVLVVLYDEPLVAFYPSAPFRLTAENSCAVAFIITKNGDGIPMQLSCFPATGDDGEQPVQVPALIQFLLGQQQKMTIKTARHSWCWQKG